jgi:hypothetical protein
MVETFINHAALIGLVDSTEDHLKNRRKAAAEVERDVDDEHPVTGGLFKGHFRKRSTGLHGVERWAHAIRDEGDNVDRCYFCQFELQDRFCERCERFYGPDGRLLPLDSDDFGLAFSDMDEDDETDGVSDSEDDSEASLEGDFHAAMGMDEYAAELMSDQFEGGAFGYDSDFSDMSDNYAIQRALAMGSIVSPGLSHRASHSAAASRARRSSHGVGSVSHMSEDDEMETLEELSEEDQDEDDTDSSMRDFIVEDDPSSPGPTRGASRSSSAASSLPNERGMESQRLGRNGRSSINSPMHEIDDVEDEEDDEDEEFDEGGAISNGRRRRVRPPNFRRFGRGGPIALTISSEADDEDRGLDEDTEALLRDSGYSQLDHDTPEEGMESESQEEDGDPVYMPGIDPRTFDVDRAILRGSVTPTADQPHPNRRPASRTSFAARQRNQESTRRTLRRTSSSATVRYEGSEADDDESEQQSPGRGDNQNSGVDALGRGMMRSRGSRLASSRNTQNSTRRGQVGLSNDVLGNVDGNDLDNDSTSDASIRPRPRRQRSQRYDARISTLFAEHINYLSAHQHQQGSGFENLEALLRANTPGVLSNIARPRTVNRNRGGSRSTTPANLGPFVHPASRQESQTSVSHATASGVSPYGGSPSPTPRQALENHRPYSQTTSGQSISGHYGNPARTHVNTNNAIRPRGSREVLSPTGFAENLAWPASPFWPSQTVPHANQRRVTNLGDSSVIPPRSGTGTPSRRSSTPRRELSSPPPQSPSRSAWGTSIPSNSPGFNLARLTTRNPYAGLMRPRQSNHQLREQTSTATLRAQPSRRTLRGQPSQTQLSTTAPTQSMRSQSSRQSLRNQASSRGLRNRGSSTGLRVSESPVSPALLAGGGVTISPTRPLSNQNRVGNRHSPEESERIAALGRQVMRNRQEELLNQRGQHPRPRLGLIGQAQSPEISEQATQSSQRSHPGWRGSSGWQRRSASPTSNNDISSLSPPRRTREAAAPLVAPQRRQSTRDSNPLDDRSPEAVHGMSPMIEPPTRPSNGSGVSLSRQFSPPSTVRVGPVPSGST